VEGDDEEDVRGLHDDCDPTGFDSLLYGEGNLFGKALLHLETSAEGLSDACEF
jgi:hypothetical protein